jgi:hypothetical protein
MAGRRVEANTISFNAAMEACATGEKRPEPPCGGLYALDGRVGDVLQKETAGSGVLRRYRVCPKFVV